MHFLIIQQKMIGDVLVASLLCKNLKKHIPTAIIDFVAYEHTLPILENNPYIDHCIPFEPKHQNSFLGLLQFSKRLRKTPYDVVIDSYAKIESYCIVLFSKANCKISYHKGYSKSLYHQTVTLKNLAPYPPKIVPAVVDKLSLLKPILKDVALSEMDTSPEIYLTKKEIEHARKQLEVVPNPQKPLIMVSVLGSSLKKTYPLAYMAELLNEIAAAYSVYFLFNYNPRQASDVQQLLKQVKENTRACVLNALVGSSLRQFLALTYHCRAVIGNEGGVINMAKALGKPTFAIFAPFIPKSGWAAKEDSMHQSIELLDVRPELLTSLSNSQKKRQAQKLYHAFTPALIKSKLLGFLEKVL